MKKVEGRSRVPTVAEIIVRVKEAFRKWLEARPEFRYAISQKEEKTVSLVIANQHNRKINDVQMNEFTRFVLQLQECFEIVPTFKKGTGSVVMCDLKIA